MYLFRISGLTLLEALGLFAIGRFWLFVDAGDGVLGKSKQKLRKISKNKQRAVNSYPFRPWLAAKLEDEPDRALDCKIFGDRTLLVWVLGDRTLDWVLGVRTLDWVFRWTWLSEVVLGMLKIIIKNC